MMEKFSAITHLHYYSKNDFFSTLTAAPARGVLKGGVGAIVTHTLHPQKRKRKNIYGGWVK